MANTLRQKMKALLSLSGKPSAHNRAVNACIALLDQMCANKEVVERVACVLYRWHSPYNSDLDSEPEERKVAWRHQAQDAIRAFVGEK